MFRPLSCYWFSKNNFFSKRLLVLWKSNSPLGLLSYYRFGLQQEGLQGEGQDIPLEFLGLHNNGFVYGCSCKSPL